MHVRAVFSITTSARTPSVSRFRMGFMTSPKTVALSSSAFPTTLLHSPLTPSPIGGTRKVLSATPARAGFSSWPIPAAATAIAAMPGRPSSSLNWPTLLPCLSPWPTIHPALPNGIPSSIVFFPRCHETGLVNRSIPTRRSSTIREPQKLKPALRSPLTWIATTILAASSQLPTNSLHCDCSAMKPYPSGTTP